MQGPPVTSQSHGYYFAIESCMRRGYSFLIRLLQPACSTLIIAHKRNSPEVSDTVSMSWVHAGFQEASEEYTTRCSTPDPALSARTCPDTDALGHAVHCVPSTRCLVSQNFGTPTTLLPCNIRFWLASAVVQTHTAGCCAGYSRSITRVPRDRFHRCCERCW